MKRITALFLSFLMVVMLLPMNAWALELEKTESIEIVDEAAEAEVFKEVETEEIIEEHFAEDEAETLNASVVTSGYCGAEGDGTNLAWGLDENGTLTIFGSGKMADYTSGTLSNGNWGTSAPWGEYSGSIKKVLIADGVETIGTYAFYGSEIRVSEIVFIPESVKEIKNRAFYNNMSTIAVLGRLEKLHSSYAFGGWGSKDVYFMSGAPLYFGYNAIEYGYADLYYLCGTEDLWEFDENGLWNGYVVNPYIPAGKVELNPSLYVASGYCGIDPLSSGKNMAWGLDKNGTLTIFGSGKMSGYTEAELSNGNWGTSAPWGEYQNSIKEIVIEDGVKSIGSYAFYGMSYMEKAPVIAGSVKTIGNCAFSDCWISGDLVIPEGVESIGSWAFGWNNFTSVTLPSTLKELDGTAFRSCSSLKNIEVSESNENFCDIDGVVYSKDKKTLVMYPYGRTGEYRVYEGTETIGSESFVFSKGEITLGENIKTIESNAFTEFSGNIIIEGQLDYIDGYAFYQYWSGDISVANIYFMNGAPLECSNWFCDGKEGEINLYYLSGTEDLWNFDENGLWNGYVVNPYTPGKEVEINTKLYVDYGYCGSGLGGKNMAWGLDKNGTLTIFGSGKMADYTSGTLSNGNRGTSAPWGEYQSSIKEIVIEDGVESIGSYAFYRMQYLEKAPVIAGSVKTIGKDAFYQCYISGDLVIPEGVESIGSWAFGWNNFTSVTLPSTLKELDGTAFHSCNYLKNIEVSENNENFCDIDGVVYSKDKKTLVMYPCGRTGEYRVYEGAETIGSESFVYSKGEITLGENIKTIEYNAFIEFSGNIIIEGRLDYIDDYAFFQNWTGDIYVANIYFMNGAPLECSNWFCDGKEGEINLYYLSGTEDLWNFDENGLWNGYVVNPYTPGKEVEINTKLYVDYGYCGSGLGGKNMAWGLDEEGTLTIFGSGKMADYTQVRASDGNWGTSAPWGEYQSSIKAIIIEDGVESIGSYAFYAFEYVMESVIPESIKTIGTYAFYSNISSVVIMGRPERISPWTFDTWSGMSKMSVFFMNGSPKYTENGAFSANYVNLYYIAGTEDLWNFDANGLWNGYVVKPYTLSKEPEFDPYAYVDYGYCGIDPMGGKNMVWTLDEDGVLTIFGSGYMVNYNTVRNDDGNSYWGTTAPWGKYYEDVTSLVLSEGIENIGAYAFYGMDNIEGTLVIPNTVKSIEDMAFYRINVSGDITVPGSVEYIGWYGMSTRSRGNLIISEGVIELAKEAFGEAYYASVSLPSTLRYVGGRLFSIYWSDNTKVTLSKNNPYLVIEDNVLFSKDKTRLIAVVTAAKTSGDYVIPDTVEIIENSAFYGTTYSSITVPESVKTIRSSAFGYILSDIYVMGEIENIETRAFEVTSVYEGGNMNIYFFGNAPKNVKYYENNIYSCSFCGEYIKIYYTEGTEGWELDKNGLWNGYELNLYSADNEVQFNPNLYVVSGYCGADPLGGKNMAWMINSKGVLIIKGSGRMKNYSMDSSGTGSGTGYSLKSVSSIIVGIKDKLGVIEKKENTAELLGGGGAQLPSFGVAPWKEYESMIKSVVIEEGVESIGSYAFDRIAGITGKITVPKTVKEISGYAFYGLECEEIIVSEGVEKININAFMYVYANCIRIPSTVTSMESAMRFNKANNIYVDEENTEYKDIDGVLYSKDGKTLVAFPGGRTGEYVVPEGTVTIYEESFRNSEIEKITITESVKVIGDAAFYGSNCKEFIILGNLDEINGGVFNAYGEDEISVYFYGDAPKTVYNADEYSGWGPSFESYNGGIINIYYLEKTKGWDLEANGLWHGYKITPFKLPADATIAIDSTSIAKGTNKTVSVSISENSNAAIIQFAIEYDPSLLKVVSCSAGSIVSDAIINYNVPGVIYFVWEALNPINSAGELLNIEFTTADGATAKTTVVEISEKEEKIFTDINVNNLEVECIGGTIEILEVLYGDVNGDGKINVIDANMVRKAAAKMISLDENQKLAADVSGDGKVNVIDANLIRKYAAKIINVFPVAE